MNRNNREFRSILLFGLGVNFTGGSKVCNLCFMLGTENCNKCWGLGIMPGSEFIVLTNVDEEE